MRDALVGLGLVVGTLLACGRGEPAPPAPAASVIANAVVAPPSSAPPAPVVSPAILKSAAVFDGDRLVACLDLALPRPTMERLITKVKEMDASVTATAEEAVAEEVSVYASGGATMLGKALNEKRGPGTAAALRPKGKPTPLAKACGEQFSGRTVIATCSIILRGEPDAGVATGIGLGITHYDAQAGDGPMRACLAAKGDWTELAHDSLERGAARHRQMYDDLKKQIDEGG